MFTEGLTTDRWAPLVCLLAVDCTTDGAAAVADMEGKSDRRPVEDTFGHVKCHGKQTLTDQGRWGFRWSWRIIMVKVYIVSIFFF